ncbi:MAG: tetratricopeptide repeat protein [Candidatus Latescibacteria bacterium]|nr:tetratricopeptide repeat protein [Candidatus Latescibacterota bacterium]
MNPWQSRHLALLVLVLPALVYLNSLGNAFHYDDTHAIVDNPHLRTLANLPAFFVDPGLFSANPEYAMYRPLLLCTFALNYALSGYAVWSYHLFSLGLHLWAVWLVFRIGGILLGERTWAGMAALVFGVHPINSEAVNYISSRSEMLAGACFLWALLLFLQRRGEGWVGGAFLAGLLSKSTAMVLPAVLALHQVIFPGRPLRREKRLYAVLSVLSLGYLVVVRRFLSKAVGAPVRSYSEQGWSQVKAVIFYLKLLCWPSGLNVDHQFQVSDSLFDPYAASALALLLSLGFLAWYHRRRHPLPCFLLGMGLIALAPASVVPLNVLVNEHRLYLSSAAFALALGYGAAQLARRGWAGVVGWVGVLVVVVLSAVTVARNRVWQDELSLWRDAVSKAPDMARPRFLLAEALAAAGDLAAATRTMEEGLKRDPNFLVGYLRIGQWQAQLNQPAAVVAAYQRGLAVPALGRSAETEQRAGLWAGLAELRAQQAQQAQREGAADGGRSLWQQAAEAYQQALALAPDQPDLLNNTGNVLQELGRPAEALALHQRALTLDPEDARTWVNLGYAQFVLGQLEAAGRSFARAVELDPAFGLAWANLAVVREKGGDAVGAAQARQRAAVLDPGFRGTAP